MSFGVLPSLRTESSLPRLTAQGKRRRRAGLGVVVLTVACLGVGGALANVGGGGGGGGNAGTSAAPEQVRAWIDQASQVLEQNGAALSAADKGTVWTIIQHESSGNPQAVNLTDSNAIAGHPSKGLMQCIDSTFNAHALPGHGNIMDPVDNIIAGVRYAISRYGSLSNVPGIRSTNAGGGYVGY